MAKKKKRRLMTDIYAEFPNANIYGDGDEMQIKRGYTSNQIPIEIDVPQAQYNPSQFQRVNPIKYLTMSERDKAIQKSERMRYNEWKQTNQQPETTETNPSGGNTNWGGVIGAAATGVLSGIKDNDWSTKEGRTRGIFQSLGVADAANNWLADTSKGDTNITEMHNRINDTTNKFITDSNDTQGAFSAIKNNNNVNLINTTVKRLNEKDFRQSWGSYWKNTLTGGLQGASAGSVGGPWGALGGAVTGVVSGLLGGFGRKRRARKAYKEYKNKMDYMQNFAGNFNTLQKLNQKQSNENLLNNGLKQQRIQELSNIRAFGGNLFETGGKLDDPDPHKGNGYTLETGVPYDERGYFVYTDGKYYPMTDSVRQEEWDRMTRTDESHPYGYWIEGDGIRLPEIEITATKPIKIPKDLDSDFRPAESIPYPDTADPESVEWIANWLNHRREQLYNNWIENGTLHDFFNRSYNFAKIDSNRDINYDISSEVPKNKPTGTEIKSNYSNWLPYSMKNTISKLWRHKSMLQEDLDNLIESQVYNAASASESVDPNMPQGLLGEYSGAKNAFTRLFPTQTEGGHHINYSPEASDTTPLHERAHAMNAYPQEYTIKKIINAGIKKQKEPYSDYYDSETEVHSRLYQIRKKTRLSPYKKVDKQWLDSHRDELSHYYLDRYDDNTLLRLFNEVADNSINNYNNIAAMGGYFDTFNLSPNMINMQNKSLDNQKYKYNNQMQPLGFLGDSKSNIFDGGGKIKTYDDNDIWYRDENGELQVRPHQNTGKYTKEDLKRDVYLSSALNWDDYQRRLRDYENPPSYFNDFKAYNNPFSSANVVDRLINYYFDNKDKQKENEHKSSSSINYGGGGNSFDFGGTINQIDPPPLSEADKRRIDFYERGYGYHNKLDGDDWWKQAAGIYDGDSARIANLYENRSKLTPDQQAALFDRLTVRTPKIMEEGYDALQDKDGNWLIPNSFDFGGTMNSMNLPTDMQSYDAGGTHEENPYGGIQVGVDNQGTPNLVEEGEFRYGNYIFSDRINVDPELLSEFNLSPLSKGKKKNNESYADVAKKMVKKAGDLNDPITKDTIDVNMSRLQQAQDAQKYKAQQDQEYADYKSALKTPTQGNPMYGSMKYNGMGDVNQGLNEGNAMASNALDNSELSNVNRSGNPMMAAYGGNIFKKGTGNLQIGFRKIKEPTLNWDNLALQRSLPNPQFISGSNYNDNALFEPVDYTQMARSNDSNWVNDKWDAYGELNNYYTPEQIANMRGTYGMSISGGVDKPFVQALQNDLKKRGYYTGNIDGVFGPKTRMALDKMNGTSAWTKDGKYITPVTTQTTANSSAGGSNPYSYKYDISRTTSDVLNKDAVSGDPTISKDATASGSTHNPQQNIDKSGEIQRLSGTYAVGKPFDAPTYSTKGRFATNAKFLPLALADSVGFTNFDYDPNLAPNYDLVAAGKTGYVPRTADHSGMYRAADLFDINAANNASQATNMAMLRSIANNSNNNRGFLGAQTSALDYNGLMGTGQNFATMFDKNNASRIAAYQDNKQTEQANVDVNNQMYRDNQQAGIQAKQMELNTLAQSMADQTQKEHYADKTNREAHDNIAGTQNLMWNNSMQFLMDEAKRHDLYNKFNSDDSQMWYYDEKLGKYMFKGDPATAYLGDAIRAKEGVTSLDADLQNEYNNYVAKVGSANVQRDYLDSLVERQAQRNKENEAKSIADRNAQMQSDIDFMNNQFSDLDNLIITDKDKSYKFFDYINSPKQVEAIRNFLNNADVSQMNPNDYKNYKALLNNWMKIRDRQLMYRNQMSPYNVTDTTNTTWVGQSNAYGGHINTKKKRNKRYTDI